LVVLVAAAAAAAAEDERGGSSSSSSPPGEATRAKKGTADGVLRCGKRGRRKRQGEKQKVSFFLSSRGFSKKKEKKPKNEK